MQFSFSSIEHLSDGQPGPLLPQGEDMAWLPLGDESRAVDLSRFSTQGQTSRADGVNAYVFSERGLFRPGETLRFGMLLRRGDWKALPPDMPLFAELADPSERTVFRRMFTTGADGLAEVSWKVPEDAPAGRYRLDVRTPDGRGMDVVLGSAAVRVEEFQPDTMALALSLSPESGRGWLRASSASANVTLRNLFGAPAADRRGVPHPGLCGAAAPACDLPQRLRLQQRLRVLRLKSNSG